MTSSTALRTPTTRSIIVALYALVAYTTWAMQDDGDYADRELFDGEVLASIWQAADGWHVELTHRGYTVADEITATTYPTGQAALDAVADYEAACGRGDR